MSKREDYGLWTFLLPLPRSKSKRERLLKTMFSTDTVLEILKLFNLDTILCQKDIVNKLSIHSNKTVLRALKELVETGVLLEEYIESKTPSGRRIKLKCYRLSLLGKWLYMLTSSPSTIGIDRLRKELLELYTLLGESIANSYIELNIDPNEVIKSMLKGAITALLKSSPSHVVADIVVIGSIAMDYHVELAKDFYNPITMEPGGSGANIASMISRLGLTTKLVSSIGLDYEGFLSILSLYNNDIDLSNIVVYDDKSTIKVLIIHRGIDVELKKLVGRQVAIAPESTLIEWDKVNGKIYYAGDTYVENALRIGIKALNEDKLFVYNPLREIIEYSPKNVVRIIVECKPLLILNEEALASLLRNTGLGPRDIVNLGVRALVVTKGSRGLTLYSRSSIIDYKPLEVKVIDPTGAGDVLVSYMLWRIHRGDNIVNALRWGAAASSLAVTRIGARYLPKPEVVEEKLDRVEVISRK